MLYFEIIKEINRHMKQKSKSNILTLVIVIVELIIVFSIIKGIYISQQTFDTTTLAIFKTFLIPFSITLFIFCIFTDELSSKYKLPAFIKIILNSSLVITLFAAAIPIGLYILKYIIHFIYTTSIIIYQTSSTIDQVILVAVISGTLTFLANLVAKYLEYKSKRMDYLAQKREIPYQKFIECFYKLKDKRGNYSQEQLLKDIDDFSQGLTLCGSKNVVEKYISFRKNANNSENQEDNLFILEEIMNEMRKDIGTHKVKKGNLLGFVVNDIKNI